MAGASGRATGASVPSPAPPHGVPGASAAAVRGAHEAPCLGPQRHLATERGHRTLPVETQAPWLCAREVRAGAGPEQGPVALGPVLMTAAVPCRAAVPCLHPVFVPEVAALFRHVPARGGGDSAACANSGALPSSRPPGRKWPGDPEGPVCSDSWNQAATPKRNPNLLESGPWGINKPLSPEKLCSKLLWKKCLLIAS